MSKKVDGQVIIDVDAQTEKFKSKISSLTSTAVKAFGAMSVAVVGATGLVIKSGVEFESAFAGVRKTVDATEEELKSFEKQLISLSTRMPQTASELAGIAEAAGQLGIKNENLMKFTETMAQLGDATNMTSETAATTLARFANITNMSQENFDRLGSSIVALGNNMATTEAEIADMALSIAGAGSQVGLTENQILALSAALSSVGIEAAAGGTAMSSLLIDIKKATIEGGEDLAEFAKVANMKAKDFKKAFEEDAAGAVLKFIEGLATAGERGKNAFTLLDDVGIKETRMIKAMLNLSGASGVLKDALEISNKAWVENTALMKEASQRYETTESKMRMIQNSLTQTGLVAFEKFKTPFKDALDTGIEGLAQLNDELENGKLGDDVDKIALAFTDLTKVVLDASIKAVPKFINGLTWLLDNGGKIISILTGIGTAYGVLKGYQKVQAMTTAWKAATSVITAHDKASRLMLVAQLGGLTKSQLAVSVLTGKIKLWTAAQIACNAVSPLGWIGLAIAGITALGVGLALSAKKSDEFTRKLKEQSSALKEARNKTEELTKAADEQFKSSNRELLIAERYAKALDNLRDKNGKIIGDKEAIKAQVDKLNEALGTSIYYYDESTRTIRDTDGAVKDLTSSIANLIETQRGQAWLEANRENYIEALGQQRELVERNIEAHKRFNDLMSDSEISKGVKQLEELNQAYANGEIETLDYELALSQIPEKVKTAAQELSGLATVMSETNTKIKDNESLIQTFEKMGEAVAKIDKETINAIASGLSIEQLGGDYSGVKDVLGKISELQDKIKDTEAYGKDFLVPKSEMDRLLGELDIAKKRFEELTTVSWEDSQFAQGGNEVIKAFIKAVDDGKDPIIQSGNTAGQTLATAIKDKTKEELKSGLIEALKEGGEIVAQQVPAEIAQSFESVKTEEIAEGLRSLMEHCGDIIQEDSTVLAEASKNAILTASSETIPVIETEASTGATAFNTSWGNSLNANLPTSTVNAFHLAGGALNQEINSFTPNPILIPVKLKGDASLSKYGITLGGATYDGTTGGSISPNFASDIISKSRAVIRSLQNNVGSVILQAKEGKADNSSKVVNIDQTNNFNVPIDKPSQIKRDFERTAKKLASDI